MQLIPAFAVVLLSLLFLSLESFALEEAIEDASGKPSVVQCDSECKLHQIEIYFSAIDRIYQKGSSEKDIDHFLSQVHDDVKYLHPEYGANFTKETWKKAFIKQMKTGAYTDSPDMETRVLNTIYGKYHVAVEYSFGKVDSEGLWKKGDAYFALFGFKDGMISSIREYW